MVEGERTVGMLSNPESWVALAFVLFVVIFGATLWRKLAAILDTRSQGVQRELDEASRLKTEANAMLADAKARRETALKEASELLQSAHQEAERLAAQARADALSAAQRRERLALDRIALAERQALIGLRQLAADAAIEAATHILQIGLPKEASDALIDQAIAEMPHTLSMAKVA